MFGRHVTINLGDFATARVWVLCVPETTAADLQVLARGVLADRLQTQ